MGSAAIVIMWAQLCSSSHLPHQSSASISPPEGERFGEDGNKQCGGVRQGSHASRVWRALLALAPAGPGSCDTEAGAGVRCLSPSTQRSYKPLLVLLKLSNASFYSGKLIAKSSRERQKVEPTLHLAQRLRLFTIRCRFSKMDLALIRRLLPAKAQCQGKRNCMYAALACLKFSPIFSKNYVNKSAD